MTRRVIGVFEISHYMIDYRL